MDSLKQLHVLHDIIKEHFGVKEIGLHAEGKRVNATIGDWWDVWTKIHKRFKLEDPWYRYEDTK